MFKRKLFLFEIQKIKKGYIKMNVVELFSGSGVISETFKEKGHKTFTIDIRKRKGICEPDLRKNIMQVKVKDIPFKKVHVLWASPPCDVFSKASIHFHWNKDGTPKTEKCHAHLKILRKTLKLIEKINPDTFFIENPDGKMKYRNELVNFLIRNNGMTKKVFYRDYGFGTLKPTNIFTNALNYVPGIFLKNSSNKFNNNKNRPVIFDNLTKNQKQSIPVNLAKEIVNYCEYSQNQKGGKN
jgi:site-specific DNA-cytosine methylase